MKNLLNDLRSRRATNAADQPGTTSTTSSTPKTSRRTGLIVAGGLALAVIGAGSAVYADAHKTITLDVDGEIRTVTTLSGSVDGLLGEQGITIGDDDVIAPSVNAALSEDSDVVVRYGREITLLQNGVPTTVTTTAVDADELLEAYASRSDDVRLVASRSDAEGRTDIGLRLTLDGPVDLLVDGVVTTVEDGSVGIDAILEDNDVVLGELDRVSIQHLPTAEALEAQARVAALEAQQAAAAAEAAAVAPEAVPATEAPVAPEAPATPEATPAPTEDAAPADVITDPRLDDTALTIVVNRVVVADEAVTAQIPFETVTEEDATRFADLPAATKVEGVEGVQTVVSTVTLVDGVEESRVLVSDAITTAPVTKVIVQGTKERPKAAPKAPRAPAAPSNPGTGGAAAPAAPAVPGDVWSQLAQCESGGRATVVSSNGLYHGLYQFSVGTWQSVGGTGLPSQASPAEQTRLAQVLQARSGWGQWPACSKKLGLR